MEQQIGWNEDVCSCRRLWRQTADEDIGSYNPGCLVFRERDELYDRINRRVERCLRMA